MKDWPGLDDGTINAVIRWIKSVNKQRSDDVQEIGSLKSKYVQGRLRTDRTAPSSNSDVATNGNDKEGDIVRAATYQYTLINDSGTLKWARSALDVTW